MQVQGSMFMRSWPCPKKCSLLDCTALYLHLSRLPDAANVNLIGSVYVYTCTRVHIHTCARTYNTHTCIQCKNARCSMTAGSITFMQKVGCRGGRGRDSFLKYANGYHVIVMHSMLGLTAATMGLHLGETNPRQQVVQECDHAALTFPEVVYL